ncbi:ThuA domain-containing protein [Jiangella mangrovi]|uniref:Glucose/arabinose dehydrogenase/regulation of enolase protein 1 (Concanavalin A-like superfamily) n=1 Tax=Jiangella mangrovi TaxID=1524084 RepID=A0A7W9LL89_9ACTN|nr:ThuA domain-containing protein [Jiangella mangrovi]MBB5787933.1 glucose/arabinose dehydrogenase/regulation of enolase protein 1 (concanavalin A-like superfamily) [Jiangella mangrovi]
MRRSSLLATLCASALALTAAGVPPVALAAESPPTAAAAEDPRFRALVFTKVTGEPHESAAAGTELIQDLGAEHDFEVVADDSTALFTDEGLAGFDVVVFNNTSSTADAALLGEEERAAFTRYIQAGGGYVGLHSAAQSEPGWDWYAGLVGTTVTGHADVGETGTHPGRIEVLDRVHPSTRDLPQLWERSEGWVNLAPDPTGDVHVLAELKLRDGIPGLDSGLNHPFSWCQVYDGGRSWYTAGGHDAAAFAEPEFAGHLLGGLSWAAGAEPGDCGATDDESFAVTQLTDELADPFELEVLPDRRVMYIQRTGQFRLIDQTTLEVTTAGDLELGLSTARHSDGLTGFALDPDFATNGWLYAMYSDPEVARINISRFTFDFETSQLDMESESRLLDFPTWRDVGLANVHMGGAVEFGPDGTLYASMGDNTDFSQSNNYAPIDEREGRAAWDAQATSANTNDLRGKVIRIQPTDDGGYTIPEGNLFPESDDTEDRTRPEIFAMGFRNPFRITVDQQTGDVLVADYGPDATQPNPARGPEGIVEWNVVSEAGNYGWPHCVGNNIPYIDYDFATGQSGEPFDCAGGPVNDSPHNTGLQQLPPVQEAYVWYSYATSPQFPELGSGGAAPMSGPVYDYDPDLESDTKFPEYYDGTWFVFEYSRNWYKTITRAEESGDLLSINPVFGSTTFRGPFDAAFGPDGSMYVIDFGSGSGAGRGDVNDGAGIYRIDYVGGDRPPTPKAAGTPTSGQLPLTVEFSSEGTEHSAGLPMTYHWSFGDGATSDEPNPSHTYTEAGNYTALLTVTDSRDRSSVAAVRIAAGNTRPEVAFSWPPHGGFFDWGDEVAYDVTVDDAEDGSIAGGEIECGAVTVGALLGHDQHAHPLDNYPHCTGTVPTITDGGHGQETNLYYVLESSFTDAGAPGVEPLTGGDSVRLNPKRREAEHFSAAEGVQVFERPLASARARVGSISHGDWIRFDTVHLANIESLTVGASASAHGGTVEVRRDAPGGELLGSVDVPVTGSADTVVERTTDLVDPGETFDVYLVFRNEGVTADLLALDWVRFNGDGVSVPAPPCADGGVDEFDGDALDLSCWSSIVRHDPAGYHVADGSLVLPTAHGELTSAQADATNLVMRPAPEDGWTATTRVTADVGTAFQQAGLVLHGGDADFAKLVVMARPDGTRRMSFFTVAGGQERNTSADYVALQADFPDTFELRLVSDGLEVTAEYSADGESWLPVGRPYGLGAATWNVGVLALSGGNGDPAIPVVDVAFDRFELAESEPQVCPDPEPADGFTALWDGKTLEDWEMVGNGSFTVTSDCTLLSRGSGGLLWYTPQAFGDFHLRLEYRMNNASDNSGVFLRFPAPLDWEGPWVRQPDDSVRGYEAQVHDDPGGGDPQKTGSIYNFATITDVLANPIGEWNTYEIRAVGQTYTVWLNGELVNTYTGDGSRALEGHIGFQNHHDGSDVEFRDVWIAAVDATCPQPDARATVVVGSVDSGVPNRAAADGCTINDLIDDDGEWESAGAFVRHVEEVLDQLLADGLVDAREAGAIRRAALTSGVGRG